MSLVEFSAPTLDQIATPQCAVAEAHQRRANLAIVSPRGILTRIHTSSPCNCTMPHTESAPWFRELHCGFMSAQFLGVATNPTDPLKLLSAETAEITAAALKVPPVDDSLPPRRVGCWLLGNTWSELSPTTDLFIDGFSSWGDSRHGGNRLTTSMRMSMLFGADAVFFLDQTKRENTTNIHTDLIPGTVRVLLRWHDGQRIQSVFRDVVNSEAPLVELQDTVVRLSGAYDVPISPHVMIPVLVAPVFQSYYHNYSAVSTEFFQLLDGEQSITQSDVAQELQKTGCGIRPVNVLVRVTDKRLGSAGLTDRTAFHGVLLGDEKKIEDIYRFVRQTDAQGMRLPIATQEVEYALHLCAVQPEAMRLCACVSLFGTLGVSGKAIHSPNSWVWVSRPAIRPITADLLHFFSIHPCSVESLLPVNKELVSSFERFWAKTTNTYRLLKRNTVAMSLTPSTSSESIDTVRIPSPTEDQSDPSDHEDTRILAAMNIDMKSTRTTLGDAYAYLVRHDGESALTKNIKSAIATLGVRASLHDMLINNNRALKLASNDDGARRQYAEAMCALAESWIDGITGLAPSAKRAKTGAQICIEPERVRRILKACGVKAGMHYSIENGKAVDAKVMTNLVIEAVTIKDRKAVEALLTRPFAKLMPGVAAKDSWLAQVEQCLAMSAAIALVASGNAENRLFLITSTLQKNLSIKTVALDGTVQSSDFNDMLRTVFPKVLILQEVDEKLVRVTSTTRSV